VIHGTPEDVIGALTSSVSVPEWRLASILDAASDAILVCSDDGVVVYFNKACEHLFACTAVQVLGCDVEALLSPQVPVAVSRHWTDRFRPAPGADTVRMRRLDGREFAAGVTVSAAPAASGMHHLLFVREQALSGRRRETDAETGVAVDGQAELVRTVRASALDELSAVLAHKLNQPLTAVILYLQAIGRAYGRETGGGELPEKVVTILEKAVREAERASSFLQRIREVHERDDTAAQPVDLNHAVEDVLDLGVFADRRGAAIERRLAPRLPPVRGNRIELQQAVIALIRGALDAAAQAGADGIRLATQRLGNHVSVVAELRPSVADDAAAGEIARNCAESTDGRRNCEKDLAIARAVAHGHGGELTVDCDGRSRGARFTLRLPLPAPAEAASSL
jgi:two-component system sensor kinase FixL